MARLKCAECGASVGATAVICPGCGVPLLADGAVVEAPEAPSPPSPAGPDPGDRADDGPAPDQCPHCGTPVPDPRHLVCLNPDCMSELQPRAAAVPGSSGPPPYSRATTREPGPPRLVVSFRFGDLELSAGEEILIGRDSPDDRLAALRDQDNISRRHATIGLASHGAWVRDERSTNGTYVNGRPVAADAVVALTDGVELRLASNVQATVQLRGKRDAD